MNGRTFNNCFDTQNRKPSDITLWGSTVNNSGYSVCMIPASQNSSAGALASWFTRKTESGRVIHSISW